MASARMSKSKPTPSGRAKKNTETSLIRSSAAEYLSFVAASGQGSVEAVYADENVWLTQKMMGLLYDVETHTVNYHLKQIFADQELPADSVIRNFRITAVTEREILQDADKVTAEIAQVHAESEFEKYRLVQDRLYVSDFDAEVKKLELGTANQETKKAP